MSQKAFTLVAGIIFLAVAVTHVLRVARGWHVVLGDWTVPMWVSWVAPLVAGYLAYEGLNLSRRS